MDIISTNTNKEKKKEKSGQELNRNISTGVTHFVGYIGSREGEKGQGSICETPKYYEPNI